MLKLSTNDQDIWITSDTHFYHKNITKCVTSWTDYEMIRDFQTIDEMTDTIINGINKNVKENDILFHLGDWSFGGFVNILNARKRINCKNIYIIYGNHDTHIFKNKLLDKENNIYAQDLFNCLGFSTLVEIDSKSVYLSHFPVDYVRFDKPHYHLHGHLHGINNVKDYLLKKNRLDIGIDSAFNMFGEYRPFNWKEIKKLCEKHL